MKSSIFDLLMLFVALLLLSAGKPSVVDKKECTLQPVEDSEHVLLGNGVVADLVTKVCTSVSTEIIFSRISQNEVKDPRKALQYAAGLLEDVEKKTGAKICPFGVEISSVFRARAVQKTPYRFGEDVAISNAEVPGWDGASISVRREKRSATLLVRYWANP